MTFWKSTLGELNAYFLILRSCLIFLCPNSLEYQSCWNLMISYRLMSVAWRLWELPVNNMGCYYVLSYYLVCLWICVLEWARESENHEGDWEWLLEFLLLSRNLTVLCQVMRSRVVLVRPLLHHSLTPIIIISARIMYNMQQERSYCEQVLWPYKGSSLWAQSCDEIS